MTLKEISNCGEIDLEFKEFYVLTQFGREKVRYGKVNIDGEVKCMWHNEDEDLIIPDEVFEEMQIIRIQETYGSIQLILATRDYLESRAMNGYYVVSEMSLKKVQV